MLRTIACLALCLAAASAAQGRAGCAIRSCPADTSVPVLMPVPSNCQLYVTCLGGKITFGYCAGNLWFDEKAQKCLPQGQAHCDHCYSLFYNNISQRCNDNSVTPVKCPADMDDDRLLPHPDDCNLFYYCVHEDLAPICRDCPANLHFNPIKKVCDHPDVAGCQARNLFRRSKIQNFNDEVYPTITPEPTDPPTTATTSKPAPVQCKTTTDEGEVELIPDPESCTHFYMCSWGKPYKTACPAGQHFNPTLLVCDNPEDAGCEVPSKETISVYSAPVECKTSTDEGDVELIPDPDSCTHFYICSWGKPHKTACPAGQHFNPTLLVCDNPEDAGCDDSVPPPPPPPPAVECKSTSDEETIELIADPESCAHFYVCTWGKPVRTACPTGQHFNPTLMVCDKPEDAGCEVARSAPISRSMGLRAIAALMRTADIGECNAENGVDIDLRADPTDCTKYYVCDWGYLIPMSCPEGLHYNARFRLCDRPRNAGCQVDTSASDSAEPAISASEEGSDETPTTAKPPPVECQTSDNEGEVELIPDPDSCTHFYICSWGKPYRTPCPTGQHFNPTLLVCDNPADAGCEVQL